MLPAYVNRTASGWTLAVWVQPGAKKNDVAGEYQGCLKVRLAAPAVDNKANKALVKYIAGLLSLKANQIELTAGMTSRRKTLTLSASIEPDWNGLPDTGQP